MNKEHDYTKLTPDELSKHLSEATSKAPYIKEYYSVHDIKNWKDVPGWINDAVKIYPAIVDECDDGDILVEIGTFFGQSACYMGELIKSSGKKIKFDTYDTFETLDPSMEAGYQPKQFIDYRRCEILKTAPMSHIAKLHLQMCGVEEFVNLIICDGMYAHNMYEDNSIKMFYTDGINDETQLYTLMCNFWKKLKVGGMIAGDDTQFTSVKNAVLRFCSEMRVVPKELTPVSWKIIKK